MIETPDQLITELINDPVFMALIGVYEFDDGTTAESIAILGSSEFIDGLSKVTGVECIINRIPDTKSTQIYNGCVPTHKAWTIHLIQYETGNGALNAADYLVQRYPGSTYSNLGAELMSEVAGVAQIALTIPANVNL